MVGLGAASLLSSAGCFGYNWTLSLGSASNNDTIKTLNIVSGVTLGVGLALATGGVALLLWDEYVPLAPEVQVSPQGGAIALAGKF